MDHIVRSYDQVMRQWSSRIRDDLRISAPDSDRFCSAVVDELRKCNSSVIDELRDHSAIPINDRWEEFLAYSCWMERVSDDYLPEDLSFALHRAKAMTTNYFCFVYLGNALFKKLKSRMPSRSVTKKCATFLTDNPVRAFRNAFAHGNWRLRCESAQIEFWARKGEDSSEELKSFQVSEQELNFWQTLARVTAAATYMVIRLH